DIVQQIVIATYETAGGAGKGLKNVMHGTWLGHPLHPVLTDVPLGAWTAAMALDAVEGIGGREDLAAGADAALAAGLLGAIGAAATGLTDWQHIDGGSRRLGLTHGLLNLAGTTFIAASLLA